MSQLIEFFEVLIGEKKIFFLTFIGFFIELFKKIAGLLTKPILSPRSPPELGEFGNG